MECGWTFIIEMIVVFDPFLTNLELYNSNVACLLSTVFATLKTCILSLQIVTMSTYSE